MIARFVLSLLPAPRWEPATGDQAAL